MDSFGHVDDAGNTLTSDEVANRRKKRGQCLSCGRKTHDVRVRLGARQLIPLSINGEVERGVCLRCHPPRRNCRRRGHRRGEGDGRTRSPRRRSGEGPDERGARRPDRTHLSDSTQVCDLGWRNRGTSRGDGGPSERPPVGDPSSRCETDAPSDPDGGRRASPGGVRFGGDDPARDGGARGRWGNDASRGKAGGGDGGSGDGDGDALAAFEDQVTLALRLSAEEHRRDEVVRRGHRPTKSAGPGYGAMRLGSPPPSESSHNRTRSDVYGLLNSFNSGSCDSEEDWLGGSGHSTEQQRRKYKENRNDAEVDVLHVEASTAEDQQVHPSVFRLVREADPSKDITSLLSAMQVNKRSAELQAAGCRRISQWAAEPDSLPTENVLKALFRIANEHPDSPRVQLHAIEAFGNFCASTYGGSVRGKLHIMGVVEVIKNAMRTHLTDPHIHKAGCLALGNLFSPADRTLDAVSDDDVDAVAMAMQAHPRSRCVQMAGCKTLVKFTNKLTKKVLQGMEMSGGVEAVADVLEFHRKDPSLQQKGIKILQNLSRVKSAMQAILAADSAELIADAMRYQEDVPDVCNAGIDIFAKFTRLGDEGKEMLCKIPDAAYMSINAMQNSPEDRTVQVNGTRVLYGLSECSEHCESVFNLGGVEAVAHAMRMIPDDVDSQACGVKVFHRLFSGGTRALSPGSPQSISLIKVTVGAMKSAQIASLQADAITLIWLMSTRDDACARCAVDFGAVGLLLSAARTHLDSSSMQEKCFDALHALAVDDVARTVIAAEGGVDVILDGMEKYISERSVQEAGLSALRALSAERDCKKMIDGRGGIGIMVFAMQVHVGRGFLQENALATMSAIWMESNQVKASDVDAVVDSMIAHPDSQGVQRWGCLCLHNMSKGNSVNASALQGSAKAVNALVNASEKYPAQCESLAGNLLELAMAY